MRLFSGFLVKFSIILCIFYTPLFCLSAEITEMPSWFWNLPDDPQTLIAVGYAQPYNNAQASYDEAFEDAANRLFIDHYCHVIGQSAVTEVPEGLMSMGEFFKFNVDQNNLDSFKKTLIRLDSLWTDDLVLMLISTREISVDKQLSPNPGFPDPAEYHNGQGVIAIGVAPDYYFQPSSWIDAERNARTHAAILSDSQIKALEEHLDDQSRKTSSSQVDVQLKNMQTLARGIDPHTKAKMVIVRAFKY